MGDIIPGVIAVGHELDKVLAIVIPFTRGKDRVEDVLDVLFRSKTSLSLSSDGLQTCQFLRRIGLHHLSVVDETVGWLRLAHTFKTFELILKQLGVWYC